MCKINYNSLTFLALISLISNFSFPQYSLAGNPGNLLVSQAKIKRRIETNGGYPSVFQGNVLIQLNSPITPVRTNKKAVEKTASEFKKPDKTVWVVATAYSSTVDQCDANPFITASGVRVHDGTLAANFLKFGTRVKFPTLYGEKIFIVEDRMRDSARGKVDLWFPTRNDAIAFGVKRVQMVILDL